MTGHAIVARVWQDGIHWYAQAEAVPEGLARAVVAGGEPPATVQARAEHGARRWPVETASGATEAAAIAEAVRRLLARGLGPIAVRGDE